MTEVTSKIIRIFIASPGGLDEERELARRLAEDVNLCNAEHWGCHLQIIGWEDTPSGYDRAQDLINKDLDKCDYFIGIVGDHWGTAPNDPENKYTSGFEEEFERAKSRKENGKIKDLSLFFRDLPESRLRDLGPSAAKVIAFRNRCIANRKPLFRTFKDISTFERLFRKTLFSIGWREFSEFAGDKPVSAASDVIEVPSDDSGDAHRAAESLFSSSSAQFLIELTQRPREWDSISSHEVARLRLIALSARRSGNDELLLGNHDANLVFLNKDVFDFSPEELRTLIETGLAGYEFNNVPLWSWLTQNSDFLTHSKRLNSMLQ